MWRHARPPESARRRVLSLLLLLLLSRRRRGRRGGREGGRQLSSPHGCGRRRQAARVHTRAVDRRAGRGAGTNAEAGADARARRGSAGAGTEASERSIAVDEYDASSAVCVHTRVLQFLKFFCIVYED